MPEYINHNSHPVHLTGPSGEIIKIASRQKVILSDYFDKYRQRGFIRLVTSVKHIKNDAKAHQIQAQVRLRVEENKRKIREKQAEEKRKEIEKLVGRSSEKAETRKRGKIKTINIAEEKIRQERAKQAKIAAELREIKSNMKLVGRVVQDDGNRIILPNLEIGYPISNNIGIGILSYNRRHSLERLINSIEKYTDIDKTTIFISDDASQNVDLLEYLESLEESGRYVVLRNIERLGIAGNTNRLLACLSRFKYALLLNDDVEIRKGGWDSFYFKAADKTNMHHFIYREAGVYGAELGSPRKVNGVELLYVDSKPQGSILAYTNRAFKEIGYFDESYGLYGMEHVDWSRRVYESGLQQAGYFDVAGSSEYFRIHNEASAMEDRATHLKAAREKFKEKYTRPINNYYIDRSDKVSVPHISYVIPFRNIDRTGAIETIINNVRAQRFPMIDIIIVEHDVDKKIEELKISPVNYINIFSSNKLFNKSKAFNLGVSKVKSESVVLQDADILLRGDYTQQIYNILKNYDSCHIGKHVVYADQVSSDAVINSQKVTNSLKLNRVVGYFEGGSLACRTATYWKCGAFNEDFWGYGCEDCDFYWRMKNVDGYYGIRTADFLHLHHGRVDGWEDHHKKNRSIMDGLSSRGLRERLILQYSQLNRCGYSEFIKNFMDRLD